MVGRKWGIFEENEVGLVEQWKVNIQMIDESSMTISAAPEQILPANHRSPNDGEVQLKIDRSPLTIEKHQANSSY